MLGSEWQCPRKMVIIGREVDIRGRGEGVARVDHEFHFGCVKYEMFMRHPRGCSPKGAGVCD